MLEGPESPNSHHKLVLPENVSRSVFNTVLLGKMGPKVAKLVNLAQLSTIRPIMGLWLHIIIGAATQKF